MGQEEVSAMRNLFDDSCNFFFNENLKMNIQISRKELIMKTNGKKRIFALLMCVMMIVSSMSVWAAYNSKTIGAGSSDSALCELYLSKTSGSAYTTPNSAGTAVSTAISAVNTSNKYTSSDGGSYASVSGSNFATALSNHQAGAYFTSLQVTL